MNTNINDNMPDIKFRLREPIEEYCNNEINKKEFKEKTKKIENTTEGANWYTICTGIESEADISCYPQLAEPITDLYADEDLETILHPDLLN